MKTTISLDDQLASKVRRAAAEQGLSVSAFIARTLDDALKRREPPTQSPFRLVTVRGGRPRRGVDLNRPRSLDIIEDQLQFGPRNSSPKILLPDVNVLIQTHCADSLPDDRECASS